MKRRVKVILVFIVLALFSCRNSEKKPDASLLHGTDPASLSGAGGLSSRTISEISKNISSPVEIANLLQTMKVPFSSDYLATSIDAGKLSTSFDKALSLGILGADLGYIIMYEKTGAYVDLLASINKIAEALNVGEFFDFKTMERLSTDNSNLDSLLFLSLNSYDKADD